jgi:hypothetical protein
VPSTLITEEEEEEIPMTGAQRGLVLTATLEGKIIHWLGVRLLGNASDSSRMVTIMGPLPYQAGVTLSAIGEATTTEPYT